MSILCVIDHLGAGGAQRQMVLLACRLAARGHRVEFAVYHPGHRSMRPPLDRAGILIHERPKAHRYSPGFAWALRRLMKTRSFDVALAYLDPASLYTEVAGVGTRTAVVASKRSAYRPGPLSRKMWLMQQAHRLADHVVVNSHHQRARMERAFPWMAEKLSTIPNGVAEPFFEAGDEEAPPPPNSAGKSEAPLRLLAASRLTPNKNAPALVEALVLCRRRYGIAPVVRWAGRVNTAKMGEARRRALFAQVEQSGLGAAWAWLGERDDVPQLLGAHDALVLPSFREGLPNAVCEALAAGRPVLASRVGDHAHLVADGERGFLFDPAKPEELADAIWRLHRLTPTERHAMGRRARRFARRTFSVEAFVRRYERLFERVAATEAAR